ncbi:type IV secretion system protein VirB5 [Xanthomonas hortorum pv. carotae str. M081]|nr:type IV secretion system protein VirB5 [Xanthomonas hortorum pv. carotae str. M081]
MRNANIHQEIHPATYPSVSQEAKNTMTTKFRHFSRVFTGLVLLCMAGAASAQWEVVDKDLNKKVEEVQDSLKLGKKPKDKDSGTEVDKPKEEIKVVPDDYGISDCSSTTAGTPVATQQKEGCELIQRTRNSQYNYMVAMYDITTKRLERLRKIEQERTEIKDNELGKLEDNTNKLIALKTLMDIDRQQMESAMFAYQTRLGFLTKQQDAQAWAAMRGKKAPSGDPSSQGGVGSFFESLGNTLGDFGKSVVAGAAMKVALDSVRSDRPRDMKPLELGK